MQSLLFTLASFIAALAILIAVHEFGHFWVARKLGVKVLRFSIGFGKPLWCYREGGQKQSNTALVRERGGLTDEKPLSGDGTEYVIAAVPLGGYVKMLDEREGEVEPAELHRAFNRQSIPVRSAIVAAGPLFNFIFTIFAFWLIFIIGDTGSRAIIGSVTPDSLAQQAGFQAGDEISHVASRYTPTWESSVYAFLSESGGDESIPVRVIDNLGNEQVRQIPADKLIELVDEGNLIQSIGFVPERPLIPPVLDRIVEGEAADRAGLQPGDRIISVDQESIPDWSGFVSYIRDKPGEAVELLFERSGEARRVSLVVGQQVSEGRIVGRIGAGVALPEDLFEQYQTEVRLGPFEAIGAAMVKTWDMSVFLVRMVGRMITGQASVKNLSGPISIAETAGKSASYGWIQFIKFLALVSLSLGVLNLLPIPILDGGHLMYFLIEAVKGSPVSEEALLQGQKMGLVILLGLMVLAFYVDISRLLG